MPVFAKCARPKECAANATLQLKQDTPRTPLGSSGLNGEIIRADWDAVCIWLGNRKKLRSRIWQGS
jgi:hypothetical protein